MNDPSSRDREKTSHVLLFEKQLKEAENVSLFANEQRQSLQVPLTMMELMFNAIIVALRTIPIDLRLLTPT